jgi:hypothetical protein
MSSYRKKPADIEASPTNEAPPVLPPPAVAEPPPAAEAPEPPPLETKNPVEEAAKEATQSALRQRLAEMENAESVQKGILQQQQRLATEPPQQPTPEEYLEQAISNLPERVQGWYRRDPQLFFNPERAAQIQYLHHLNARQVGEGTEEYLTRMESMLFASNPRRETNGANGQHPVQSAPAQRQSAPPQRQAAPARPQYSGMPPAAPPSRDVPSASTGRPMSEPLRPTAQDIEYAELSGVIETYMKKKLLMKKLQAQGM